MFVRKKVTNGRTYHYLVECHRAAGTVRQRVLAYLGRYASVPEALEGIPREIQQWRAYAESARARAEEARQQVSSYRIKSNGGQVPRSKCRGPRRHEGRYWGYRDRAEVYDRRVAQLEQRLQTLRPFVKQ